MNPGLLEGGRVQLFACESALNGRRHEGNMKRSWSVVLGTSIPLVGLSSVIAIGTAVRGPANEVAAESAAVSTHDPLLLSGTSIGMFVTGIAFLLLPARSRERDQPMLTWPRQPIPWNVVRQFHARYRANVVARAATWQPETSNS
jgi:hypothetical protein